MIRLKSLAKKVEGRLVGDGDTVITGIAGIREAEKGDITFVAHTGFAKYLKDCRASAFLVGEDADPEITEGRNVVVVKNPTLAYAAIAELFDQRTRLAEGVSELAFVSPHARVSQGAAVGPYAYVGDGSVIGKDAAIYPFAYIGNDVKIGSGTTIYPHVTIYDRVKIGKRVTIHGGAVIGSDGFGYVWDGKKHVKIPQIGNVEIEDDVEIGANVTIDRGSLGKTMIGRGVKIDNLSQIAHNVFVGENSIIVAQVGIAGSAVIGRNVVLAGQAGVRDHVTVGDNVKAGGQTGITKDVPENSLIMGTPHLPFKEWAKLQGYFKALPNLFARMKQVEQKLTMEAGND
jgi:UDP-3-O-[3-hydroxymyristoyl] glucosamine N-acyltransferase